MFMFLRIAALCVLLCVSPCIVSVLSLALEETPRIIAMGDLHGDLTNTLSILQFANIIDEEGRWSGEDTIFVQTGDIVDRGPDTIKLYALMQRLRREAKEQGGQLVPLLGNHEIMNLVGDWRYVSDADIDTFGGFEKRKKAFQSDGSIGSYLIGLNMTAKVGSTVFCHGGIHPGFAQHGVEWINDMTQKYLASYMESHGHVGDPSGVFGGHGPTWYRGYALDDEDVVCPLLDDALELLQAKRMVVGHTVQRDGKIHTRCNGKVVLIDIGISKVYGGHRGALEIVGDQVTALYDDGKRVLLSELKETPQKIEHLEL